MFILRRITSENLQSNTVLGDSYLLINADRDKEEFFRSLKVFNCSQDDIYGFISYDGGRLIPLYNKSHYFIMASDGKTFDNITRK